MRSLLSTLILAATLMGTHVAVAQTPTETPPRHMAQTFELTTNKTVRAQYLLDLPKGYDAKGEKKWPLILFLHGAGERGDDVQRAAIHGPPKEVREGRELPFVIVTPLCPAAQRWSNDVLSALLDEVMAKHAIDPARVYLTGLSMGGYGTWSLGVAQPERFAAIAPICGGGMWIEVLLAGRDRGTALKSLPVWAFHGAKDQVVPLEESERMVNAMKRIGCENIKLTVYPAAEHDSWTQTYSNPEFYEWLLKHERRSVSNQ